MLLVTKKFLENSHAYEKGDTYTFKTYQPFNLGGIYTDCVTGKKYEIVSIEEISDK